MKTFKRLTIPYIVWMIAMIVIPMFLIVVYAFTTQGNDVATLQFTFDNFKKFFTDPDFLKTLWLLQMVFIAWIMSGYLTFRSRQDLSAIGIWFTSIINMKD